MVYTGYLAIGAGALSDCVIPNKEEDQQYQERVERRGGTCGGGQLATRSCKWPTAQCARAIAAAPAPAHV